MDTREPLFDDGRTPLAYLITFRCYGTWLHGDERGSTDRYNNRYGRPFIPPNERWLRHNKRTLKHAPVVLDAARRDAVELSVRETCQIRRWLLRAVGVRTNHVHVVASSLCKPEPMLTALKANATLRMRQAGCWAYEYSPWADGGSRRYLMD